MQIGPGGLRDASFGAAESLRIQTEFRRRAREIDPAVYAVWDPAQMFMLEGARRHAALLLHRCSVFPHAGTPCLEIGFGRQGWLSVLLSWGVRETDLHGIELDEARAAYARQLLPVADLRRGNAMALPWDDGMFGLVVVSTVFTSILDDGVRRRVASEVARVTARRGALLWYDFAFDNPRNPNVRGIRTRELRRLFPGFAGPVRSVTLAPPLARLVAPRSWLLATMLESVPPLPAHRIGVLVKRS